MKVLEIKSLSVGIGNDTKVTDSELLIESGDVVLLTGANGCGKSTIIKIIMGATFDYNNLQYTGTKAVYYKNAEQHELLSSEKEMEFFRRNVCYISQEDEFESDSVLDCFISSLNYIKLKNKEQYVFSFLTKHSAADSFFHSSDNIILDRKCRRLARKIGLKINDLSNIDKKSLKLLSLNTKQLSGGQKKLINILSNLIRYEYCNLIILDEPLNNLDYGNVRAFSNILTAIYKEKPELAILIVTHCRSIPIINKVIEIDTADKKLKLGEPYSCSSCFGKINSDGYYC